MHQEDQQLIAELLLEQGYVASLEEATAIVSSVVSSLEPPLLEEETGRRPPKEHDEYDVKERKVLLLRQGLQDYAGLTPNESLELIQEYQQRRQGVQKGEEAIQPTLSSEEEEELSLIHENVNDLVEEESEDLLFLGPGECELCERTILLTRHHLIPKSTWPRIKPRLERALDVLNNDKDDMDNRMRSAEQIVGEGLAHLLPELLRETKKIPSTSTLQIVRDVLAAQTCEICRPCHSAVHRYHDNRTLALEFSTVDQLLNDDSIRKFARWAHKQRPGRYSSSSKVAAALR